MRKQPAYLPRHAVLKASLSVAALALAAPLAIAQTQPQQERQMQQPQAQQQQGGADITVQQPAPEITVKQPPPQVTVEQPKPDVKVQQTGEPKVQIQQQPSQQQLGQEAGQERRQQQLGQMGRGIVGKDVYGSNNENIGEVEDVVMGSNNQVQSALVDVGGFLGIGARRVAVPIDNLRLEGDRLVSSMTRQQIEQLPEHEQSRGTTGTSD